MGVVKCHGGGRSDSVEVGDLVDMLAKLSAFTTQCGSHTQIGNSYKNDTIGRKQRQTADEKHIARGITQKYRKAIDQKKKNPHKKTTKTSPQTQGHSRKHDFSKEKRIKEEM